MKKYRLFAAILSAAVLARGLLLLAALRIHGNDANFLYWQDGARFLREAKALASGDHLLFIYDVPLYPVLLAGALRVFGHLAAPAALNIVFFAVSACFVHACARRLSGPRAGIAALTVYCFYPSLVVYSILPMAEPLYLCFFTASLYCFLRFLESGGFSPLILCSLLTACAALTKECAMLLPVAYLPALVFSGKPGRRLRAAGLLLALHAAFLSPLFAAPARRDVAPWVKMNNHAEMGWRHLTVESRKPSRIRSYLEKGTHFFWGTGLVSTMRVLGKEPGGLRNGVNEIGKTPIRIWRAGPGWVLYQTAAMGFIAAVYVLAAMGLGRLLRRGRHSPAILAVSLLAYFVAVYAFVYNARYFVSMIPALSLLVSTSFGAGPKAQAGSVK